jgi:Bacteriophage head to tail connecting protein
MGRRPLTLCQRHGRDGEAQYIAATWFNYNSQRQSVINRWQEVRNYIFATDTTTTTNKSLPWKNSTTLPKLCQIRDNLHSNYISALFPNDDWMKWEAYSKNDATKQKVGAIEAYMGNKLRTSGFRGDVSSLVYDFIDYGNAFVTVDFESSYREDAYGKKVTDYIGPRARRISPYDLVFNPLASSFKDSFKIVRSLKNVGELHTMSLMEPENFWLQKALSKRKELYKHMNAYGIEESAKHEGLTVDGFGNYTEYLQSGYVEFLDFYGDIYNSETGEGETGVHMTIVDRMWIINKEKIPSWLGHAPIYHAGWRKRPDNLWAMGPLENLVGMQYRMDHLENLKADAMDLAVLPPLVIAGEVEQFTYGPGEEIHIDENGSVTELARNVQWVLQANNEIDRLEGRMEQFVGAPREAMGIRTAGEKTAFEVQQLQNAAGRIFQEKTTEFEITLLEPLLNAMLETSRRNMSQEDVVRVMDNDLGVTTFMSITKDDITASGVLRPIGARHFAAQAQMMQNLTAISNTPLWQQVSPHLQTKKLAATIEDLLNINRYSLFSPNAAVFDQQETQRLVNQAGEDLMVEAEVAPPPQ